MVSILSSLMFMPICMFKMMSVVDRGPCIYIYYYLGKSDLSVNLETKLMMHFLHLTFYSIFAVPIAKLGLILLDPCSPPFLLSMRGDCSSIDWTKSFGYQNLILIFDVLMDIHVFVGGSLEIVYNFFTGIVCLLNYFAVLRR